MDLHDLLAWAHAERESFATFHAVETSRLHARELTCEARERELAGAQERLAGRIAWADRVVRDYRAAATG